MGKNNGKRYHFLYRTTNLITNQFYVGIHSTYSLNDGYLGSGKRLKRAIKKYGVENFKCEILEFFESREEVLKREFEIVNEKLLNNSLCMNLIKGGKGGFTKEAAAKGTKTMLNKIWSDPDFIQRNFERKSEMFKKFHKEGKLKPLDWTGRKHTEEAKKKIGLANSKYVGEKSSQYGTCWITNGKENKKIKKDELQNWLKQNWKKGRKMNL